METEQSSYLPVSQEQKALPKNDSYKNVPDKKIIRELGLKVTQQRLLILDIVRNGPNHFTAQEIYEVVTEKNPDVGFATVYRFLKKLSEQHFVTEVRMGGMPARYEWAAKKHHDHLTCTRCGSIVEFENQKIEDLQEQIADRHGFRLTHHILELYGLCGECQNQ
ncbi:MAG: transcriptional repressor [Bdellovibrionales bacterium]|nr:transcriptional repressor [Bdellovibrionales bacterium]